MGKGDMKAKAKPRALPTTWDSGPASLAAISNPSDLSAKFKAWLRDNPKAVKPKAVAINQREGEAEAVFARRVREAEKAAEERAMTEAAQMFYARTGTGANIEPADWTDPKTGKRCNPNGVKRARRQSVADRYFSRGQITSRQFSAADALLRAWEANFKTPPAINPIRVQSSPKPDAGIAIQMDRRSRYHRIAKHVEKWRAYVMHVARDDRFLSSMPGYRDVVFMERLRDGLDSLADKLERQDGGI